MTLVAIELPEEAFSALRRSPSEFVRDMRVAAAVYWYQKGEISQERAAQIADMSRTEFLEHLARERVDVFRVDIDDLKRELMRGTARTCPGRSSTGRWP